MLQIRTDVLEHNNEATKLAVGELPRIRAAWDQSTWDEMDWSRIKELRSREIVEDRRQEAIKVQSARALECPNFVEHVSMKCIKPFCVC